MDDYTFLTHSVYKNRQSGEILLLIHDHPMALRSLLLTSGASGFDTRHFRRIGVDEIIQMRRSGQYEELNPLSAQELKSLLLSLLKQVSVEDAPRIQALIEQLPEE